MNSATEKFLAGLKSNELLLKLTWDEWLSIDAPYSPTGLTTADAWTRYHRNGYDWDMSGAALAGMVASGEVPLSPTIFDADVTVAKQKGAPIEWRPIDPVVTTVGYSALSAKSAHPHAALLFLDYLHSKEGQQLIMGFYVD